MSINATNPRRWNEDIQKSVDFWNQWFLAFAPQTFQQSRRIATGAAEAAMAVTDYCRNISPTALTQQPKSLAVLRMCTAPPISQDRLVGLANIPKSLVLSMEEKGQIPVRSSPHLEQRLEQICTVLSELLDTGLFGWISEGSAPSTLEVYRAATVVADRYCGVYSNPIIRNAQEERQLATLNQWLESRGYHRLTHRSSQDLRTLTPSTYANRFNIAVQRGETDLSTVNIPVDVIVMPHNARPGDWPILIEAKSAGDFTNPNKRRKEEAAKVAQLRRTYGEEIGLLLFLCGYFDTNYLGYEAAAGLDWVWEHRLEDLESVGL